MIVRESSLDVTTPTGPMRTAVFTPVSSGGAPRRDAGLVLYSEIFQLTAPIRRLATQLAGLGYVVMAPEIYHADEPPGCVLGYDDVGKTRGNALKESLTMTAFDADAHAVLKTLAEHPACNGRLGAFGVCLGGHLAFRAALHPQVLAAACFYPTDLHGGALGGGKTDTLARAGEVRGELLLVFGRQDPHVPREGRRLIYETLDRAGTSFTWHEFNAAHAFLRDEGERYDPSAARLGIGLAADLFSRCL
jgi:carboxymethylenebutenolidase